MEPISPDHPQVTLLFAIEGDPSDEDTEAMGDAVEELAKSREWTLAPPEFVNVEEDSIDDPEDTPVITVGGLMKRYSSYPGWREKLPTSIDRAQYRDVCVMVERMKEVSRESALTIVVEYDGEAIGYIKNGVADDPLMDGLLGEWDRILARLEAEGR